MVFIDILISVFMIRFGMDVLMDPYPQWVQDYGMARFYLFTGLLFITIGPIALVVIFLRHGLGLW